MSTTLEQLQTELAQVSAAISASYGSAEYEIRDGATTRRLKRQDLNVLLARQSQLKLSIDRLSGTGRAPSFGMVVDNHSPLNT
jgi:hypothetical protein